MTTPIYRTSSEYKEILRLLQKASEEAKNFVWQTSESGRTVVDVEHLEIDFVAREVVLTLNQNLRLDPTKPLYVKLDHRSSVFKVTTFEQSLSKIQFAFPDEIKTLELRSSARLPFNLKDEKTVSLKPSLGNHRETGGAINVRVMDTSEFGLGLIVSEQNRHFLRNNRILWITHLLNEELRHPILAEVVYFTSEGISRKQKDLKVGLRLSSSIPKEAYSKFLQ
jgi:hypothetical protein